MFKIKEKFFLIIIFSFFLFSMTSCFKKNLYIFQEGKYFLENKSEEQIADYKIEECFIEFTQITEEEYLKQNGKNVLRNRKNKECFSVIIHMSIQGESQPYSIYFIEDLKRTGGDQIDIYYMELFLLDQDTNIECSFDTRIELKGNYYSENPSEEANELRVEIKDKDNNYNVLILRYEKNELV